VVELDLDLYLLAKELHVDIDEVRKWNDEKIIMWLCALGKLAQRRNKAYAAAPSGNAAGRNGGKFTLKNGRFVRS